MKAKLLNETDCMRTFAIVFDKGDDVQALLIEWAGSNRFSDAHLSAIGAFSEIQLGFFDRERKMYKTIPVKQQVEVLSFARNIASKEGKPMLHAHVVVGKSDGTAHGGHFLGGRVWPTLEMILTEMPVHLRRTHDDESGLALINLVA